MNICLDESTVETGGYLPEIPWRQVKRRSCGKVYVAYVCPGCGKTKTIRLSCKSRFCPECAVRISERFKNTYGGWIKMFRYPVSIVLTIENVKDDEKAIKEAYEMLVSGFRKLRRRKFWKGSRGDIIKGVWRVELTYNQDSGTWHVHLHCIADIVWRSQEKLSEEWKDITGGYIVWIKRADKTEKAINELCKYITNFDKLRDSIGDNFENVLDMLERVFYKRRTYNFFGECPDISGDDEYGGYGEVKCNECGESVIPVGLIRCDDGVSWYDIVECGKRLKRLMDEFEIRRVDDFGVMLLRAVEIKDILDSCRPTLAEKEYLSDYKIVDEN